MARSLLTRMLRPFGRIGEEEGITALLMFSYSFLAMTSYNIVKPITRSTFIGSLGANNLPYIQLSAGILIGFIMAGYSWLVGRLPRRWALQIVQGGIALLLVCFWLLFQTGQEWVSVAFYFFGLILGILLISQFWTLANVVYDARQAKRLFGFIGGGAPLGGMAGSLILTVLTSRFGAINLLLVSAGLMVLCLTMVSSIIAREHVAGLATAKEEKGVGAKRALELLRQSPHLQLIALVISFAAIGAAIIEQQLNMAAQASKGQEATDAITSFLGQVQLWTSTIGFILQIWLTSRIHRFLGIGFALMILPISLGSTATVMLLNAALWAPGLARVLDQSLRYTVDKTTREILYMPLPLEIKYEAKPFVDVTVDRFAKGLGAVLLLVLIQPWGLELNWQQLSFASVAMTCLWLYMAVRAKDGYRRAFRQSLENQDVKPSEVRLAVADLSTVETLIQELASPEESRVLYAIDMLESLDKRNLVTPLLLYHESPAVRVRALGIFSSTQHEISSRWLSAIEHMVTAEEAEVRHAAIGALAKMRHSQADTLLRGLLDDGDPRISMTAALALARSEKEEDAVAAEGVLKKLVSDVRDSTVQARRDLAAAIRRIPGSGFRRLLMPLLQDPDHTVAAEAMRSVRALDSRDFLFVPVLVSLLRNRRLKSEAREQLISHGEEVLPILRHFLRDPAEHIWVRRHIPATIARIPCQGAMDILIEALEEADGFMRFKVLAGIERLHQADAALTLNAAPLEKAALEEAERHAHYRSYYRRLFEEDGFLPSSLLARAMLQKVERAQDRIYRILGILHPWQDIAAARAAIERGEARSRAAALEYLDNLLTGVLRKQLMPVLEQPGVSQRPPNGKTEPSPAGLAALSELIHDPSPEVAACAIYLAWERKLALCADSIERVLAQRDARDWSVFEAASWVLAAFRMPESRRSTLWRDSLPAVELAHQLRMLPLFATVPVDELFRLAEAGRQLRHEPGKLLHQEGTVPESLQFLLNGALSCRSGGEAPWLLEPPAALGVHELLEGKPMSFTARTATPAVCLVWNAEEFRTLLSDSTDLVEGFLHMLLADKPEASDILVFRCLSQDGLPMPVSGLLKPVDKALALRSTSFFSGISSDEMLRLATIAEEARLAEGAILFQEGDPAYVYVLVCGETTLDDAAGRPALTAGAGDAIGIIETLTGLSMQRRGRVRKEGKALRISREDLFDLMGQRPEFLQQLFAALRRRDYR